MPSKQSPYFIPSNIKRYFSFSYIFNDLIRHFLIFLIFCFPPAAFADELEELADTSKVLIRQFSEQLQTELTQAIQAGGPENAIDRCRLKAPEISAAISNDGWIVRRTSLKVRNPDNAPDDFETKVLNDFEQKYAEGRTLDQLAYFKMEEVATHSEFRYIKAIPTGELCLQCHGEKISRPVLLKLEDLYPQDQAKNFKVGDIRGAFTLRKVFQRNVPELEQAHSDGPVELPDFEE